MKEFCEIENCENPGFKEVPVSVDKPSDQKRTLCATCDEAYSTGVQHGTFTARHELGFGHIDKLLSENGFVVVGINPSDPSTNGPFEAWAYRGPLDFHVATPVTFGVGRSVLEALEALDSQFNRSRPGCGTATDDEHTSSPNRSP
jgi:hypothetical protein